MDDLIKISKDESGIETVDARDLWEFIESKQEFSNWIRTRIREYGFQKDNDYIVFDEIIKNNNGGRPQIKYCISIDMAKQLAMVERNEKGRTIRQWFIDRENELRKKEMSISNPPLLPDFNDPVAAARAWADAKEAELKAKLEIKKNAPFVHIANEFLTVPDSLKGTDEIAKELGIGEITLFKILRENKFFHYVYQNGKKVNVPYQKHIDAGRVVVKNRTTDIGTDEEKKINYSRSYFTPKGEAYICHMLTGNKP